MYRLLTLVVIFFNCKANAAGTISTTLSEESSFQLSTHDSKKSAQGITFQTPKLFNHLILTEQINSETQDFSDNTLTLQSGQTTRLSQIDDGRRQLFSTTAEYQQDSILASFSTTQDVKPSSFSKKYYSLQVQKSFYSGATQVSVQYETSKQNQPESYFINPSNLQSQKRLGIISNTTVTLGLEQIFTENLRSKFQYSESRFEKLRPLQKTLRTSASLALGSRWTLRNDLGISSENRGENLSDDRGYFQAQWMENQLSYEWQLDSFLGFGWSTVLENEDDPRRNYTAKLGADTVGAFVDKKFKDFTVSALVAQTQTSEEQSGLSARAEIKWEL